MKGRSIKIFWNGQAVGEVLEPKVDNFDFYGKWVPSSSDAAAEFLSALREGEQLEVQLGDDGHDLAGTVETEPEEEIEIKLRPGA